MPTSKGAALCGKHNWIFCQTGPLNIPICIFELNSFLSSFNKRRNCLFHVDEEEILGVKHREDEFIFVLSCSLMCLLFQQRLPSQPPATNPYPSLGGPGALQYPGPGPASLQYPGPGPASLQYPGPTSPQYPGPGGLQYPGPGYPATQGPPTSQYPGQYPGPGPQYPPGGPVPRGQYPASEGGRGPSQYLDEVRFPPKVGSSS